MANALRCFLFVYNFASKHNTRSHNSLFYAVLKSASNDVIVPQEKLWLNNKIHFTQTP